MCFNAHMKLNIKSMQSIILANLRQDICILFWPPFSISLSVSLILSPLPFTEIENYHHHPKPIYQPVSVEIGGYIYRHISLTLILHTTYTSIPQTHGDISLSCTPSLSPWARQWHGLVHTRACTWQTQTCTQTSCQTYDLQFSFPRS